MKDVETRKEHCQTVEEWDWETIEHDYKEYQNLIIYRPWMYSEKMYKLGFDPRAIDSRVETMAEKHDCGQAELAFLIQLGVELGDNLDAIERAVRPDQAIDFRRLRDVYGLISKPLPPIEVLSNTSVTLSRLCSTYPTHACLYLHERPASPRRRGRGVVSPETMAALVPEYPPAMMTSAFAFLVPNRIDAWCVLLMKAYMLHEYESQGPSVDECQTSGPDDHKDKIIVHVVKRLLAAIAATCVSHYSKMEFLKRIGLVRTVVDDVGGENIFVAEQVAAAAQKWDEKDSKNLTNRFIKFGH